MNSGDAMRFLKNRDSIHFIWFSLVVFILLIGTMAMYRNIALNNQMNYLKQSNDAFHDQISVTIDRYEVFSEYLFNTLIDENVLEMMYDASGEDSELRDVSREQLYHYLLDDYQLITAYDFRQLHFHLPNGDSFLRFHTPQRYGDNLFEYRTSIKRVNTDLEVVKGFEEGRIYNGYRFVYPLFYNDQHVGSVEVSISIATILDMLYVNEADRGHFFLMRAEVVHALVFEEYLGNYSISELSDFYYFDRVVYAQFNDQRVIFAGNEIDDFFDSIHDEVAPKIIAMQPFYFTTEYDGSYYTLQFMSLINIDGNHVGYIFTVYEDLDFRSLILQDYVVYPVIVLFYGILYFSLFVYVKDKKRIIKLSQTDSLTGLYNRLYFNTVATKELERSKRYDNQLSLIFMDIDHFKQINDTYGHLMGDEILREIANTLTHSVRQYDVVSRWGGEEFALLLPQTSRENACKVARKIKTIIAQTTFPVEDNITLSFGVASFSDVCQSMDDMFLEADKNLYRAKELGRDTIVSE